MPVPGVRVVKDSMPDLGLPSLPCPVIHQCAYYLPTNNGAATTYAFVSTHDDR